MTPEYTLYTGTGCPACVELKRLMKQNEVSFNEVNIREAENAMKFLQEEGHRTIPQVYTFNGEYVPVSKMKEICREKQAS